MIYFCAQKNRRALVLQSKRLNGIDFLEVLGEPGCGKQLAVTFLHDPGPLNLKRENFVIAGGAPVALASQPHGPSKDQPLTLILDLDRTGDFSTYTLSIVTAADNPDPPDGLDPQLASLDFSFKAGCPTPADCLPDNCCPGALQHPPDINYLAKDYDGFRQAMLDRMAVLASGWNETHAADLGVALVETLAYAADHLSYQQDAVSTEAYLGTARNRISLRRHARLVDYRIGEGSNARAFICVTLASTSNNVTVPTGTLFYVRVPGLPTVVAPTGPLARKLAESDQPVFASLRKAVLFREQNVMNFYTWSDADCCLPAGATEATLAQSLTTLLVGDVLIFEEVVGPKTGDPADADPTRRWAVRLTSVATTDHHHRPLVDPLTNTKITRIAWAADDALPFPICISSTTDATHGARAIYPVSVARGNVIAADHGVSIGPEDLGTVPAPPPAPAAGTGCTCGSTIPAATPRSRYYPRLARSPLTFSIPYNPMASARAFLAPEPKDALP